MESKVQKDELEMKKTETKKLNEKLDDVKNINEMNDNALKKIQSLEKKILQLNEEKDQMEAESDENLFKSSKIISDLNLEIKQLTIKFEKAQDDIDAITQSKELSFTGR